MIVKTRDAIPETIQALEWRARSQTDPMTRSALVSAAARLRADPVTADACALLDQGFGEADDWALIHDLRLRVGGHAVQICHVLINDYLECVCIDSRYLVHGVQQLPDGRFEAFSALGAQTIASPVAKASRDARMLRTLIESSDMLPRRFGIGPRASVRAMVLTDPALRVGLSGGAGRGGVDIVSADAVFALLWKQRRRRAGNPFERVSRDRLLAVATRIAGAHRATVPRAMLAPAPNARYDVARA